MGDMTASIQLDRFVWLGFDMDHSWVRYTEALEELVFNSFRDYIAERGYPKIAKQQFDQHFMQKGLVLDLNTGDFLQLDRSGRIIHARHGSSHTALTSAEIEEKYGVEKRWELYSDILQDGKLRNKPNGYCVFTTYFDIPSSQLWAALIDMVDRQEVEEQSYSEMLPIIADSFSYNFLPEAFQQRRGKYFASIQDDPSKYLVKSSDDSSSICDQLRRRGHRLLLVTNSRGDYTDFVMKYCHGPNWQDLFDHIVVRAMKPSFFASDLVEAKPFLPVDRVKFIESSDDTPAVVDQVELVRNNKVLARGSSYWLREALGVGTPAQPCLYFGDHLEADVQQLPENWFGAAVVEEVEHELHNCTTIDENVHESRITSNKWVPLLSNPHEKIPNDSRHEESDLSHSHWLELIHNHATICISDVSKFLREYHVDFSLPGRKKQRSGQTKSSSDVVWVIQQ